MASLPLSVTTHIPPDSAPSVRAAAVLHEKLFRRVQRAVSRSRCGDRCRDLRQCQFACQLAADEGAERLGALVLEGNGVVPGSNDTVRGVAAPLKVEVADVYGPLGPDDRVDGPGCLHPDNSGNDMVTQRFAAALQ